MDLQQSHYMGVCSCACMFTLEMFQIHRVLHHVFACVHQYMHVAIYSKGDPCNNVKVEIYDYSCILISNKIMLNRQCNAVP